MTENAPAPAAEEPSIEEILASIRKIISDEPGADAAAPEETPPPPEQPTPAPAPEEDILDLAAFSAPESSGAPMDLDLADDVKMDPIETSLLPPHLEQARAAAVAADNGIASPETVDAAAAALARLQRPQETPNYAATTQLWVGPRTIEQVVEDLLRPMLKTWLDANLPKLVERLVEKELARMSKRAGD